MTDADPVDDMTAALRSAMAALDLRLDSASGAHVFNGATALDDLARSLLARRVLAPSMPADRAERGLPLDVERHPESYCHRCGGPNVNWFAPSPLWNAVMRGGDINGPWQWDDIVCPTCFAVLAEATDIAADWRLDARKVNVELAYTTPSGRVWDPAQDLWVEPPARSDAGLLAALRSVLALWDEGAPDPADVDRDVLGPARAALAAADRAERTPEWEWDHNHPISRRPPLAAVQEKCPACIVGNAKRRAGDIAAPHIAADRAERGLPLAEDAKYLADAAAHLAAHFRGLELYCEDLDNVEHFAAKVHAALAADPQSPTDG